MNNLQLSGRLTKEAEIKYLTDGKAVTTFILAVDMGLSKEKKEELQKKGKATAEFIPIVVYGKTAENVANFLEKGSQVIINGRIHIYKFEQDGVNRYVTQIIANNVEFIGTKKKNENTNNENVNNIFDTDDNCFLDCPDEEDIPF